MRDSFGAEREILRKIVGAHADGSEEHEAIKLAVEALLFIELRGHREDFEKSIKESSQPLTEEQVAHLQSIGCAPW